jgi:hypothetical protein
MLDKQKLADALRKSFSFPDSVSNADILQKTQGTLARALTEASLAFSDFCKAVKENLGFK